MRPIKFQKVVILQSQALSRSFLTTVVTVCLEGTFKRPAVLTAGPEAS
jgi:hypothetical protein